MDLLIFAVISFFGLAIVTLLKFINAYLSIYEKNFYKGFGAIILVFVLSMFLWTVFFISVMGTLGVTETYTTLKGTTTTTTTYSTNLYEFFFSFLTIASVFLILNTLFTLAEIVFELRAKFNLTKRGRYIPEA